MTIPPVFGGYRAKRGGWQSQRACGKKAPDTRAQWGADEGKIHPSTCKKGYQPLHSGLRAACTAQSMLHQVSARARF